MFFSRNGSVVKKLVLVLLLGAAVLLAFPFTAMASGQGGRIENEIKLDVPREDLEAVWAYLNDRYVDPAFLQSIMPGDGRFKTSFSTEVFYDTYFDNDELALLRNQSGLRYRRRYFPDNPSHEKHGRKLVQLKLNRGDGDELARTEIKFEAEEIRKIRNEEDYHPLLGLVHGPERYRLRNRLEALGMDARSFKPVIELTQIRRRVYISHDGKDFATITLDEISAWKWLRSAEMVELELELNENGYTFGTEAERRAMEELNAYMQRDILERFPGIKQDQTPKYNKVYGQFEDRILFLRQSVVWGAPIEAFLGFGLVAVGMLAFRRYRGEG